MKDIKFRAYCEEIHSWVYGGLIHITEGYSVDEGVREIRDYYIIDETGVQFKINNAETIGQYTGLKDKNGVEIYDGDIIKVDLDTAIVQYSDEYSGFILKHIEDYYFDSQMLAHNIDIIDVVIGNIYENKELLGE